MLRLGPQEGAQALFLQEEEEDVQEKELWWLASPKSRVQGPKKEGSPSWSIRSPFIVVVKLISEASHAARGTCWHRGGRVVESAPGAPRAPFRGTRKGSTGCAMYPREGSPGGGPPGPPSEYGRSPRKKPRVTLPGAPRAPFRGI